MTPARLPTLPRLVVGAASVAVLAAVVFTAASLGPDHGRRWLLFCGLLAVIAGTQSAAWDPADLKLAFLFALPPILRLMSEGSPAWLIGPLGAGLLLAGELNALSWDCEGARSLGSVGRRRLLNTGALAALGLGAALVVGLVAQGAALRGTTAVLLAAVALAALGGVVLRRAA